MNIKNREEIKFYVYKLISPSGKIYIGITHNIIKRMEQHRRAKARYEKVLYKAVKKYGWENFKMEILYQDKTTQEACAIEKELIIQNNSLIPNGYNVTPGGETGNYLFTSDKTRDLIRQTVKNLWQQPEYRAKIFSEKTKRAKSEASKKAWSSGKFETKKKRILCVNTGQLYDSLTQAQKSVGSRLDASVYNGARNEITGFYYRIISNEEYQTRLKND